MPERTLVTDRGATVWFTGLSGSGKSTIAEALDAMLRREGSAPYILDGDALREGLNGDLGFSAIDRAENVRRVGEVALLFAKAGHVSLVPVISPYRKDRNAVRERHDSDHVPFLEVYVATPLDVCEARDPKGLYVRARSGEIEHFTGISDPYEEPDAPDLVLLPSAGGPDVLAAEVQRALLALIAR